MTIVHLPIGDNRDLPPTGPDVAGPPAVESDPLYTWLLLNMQQGRWLDAADMLTELEGRYPGAIELANIRLSLALHLSAEESWSGKVSRAASGMSLPMPLIRALAVVDLLLYALIVVMLYLGRAG